MTDFFFFSGFFSHRGPECFFFLRGNFLKKGSFPFFLKKKKNLYTEFLTIPDNFKGFRGFGGGFGVFPG